MAVSVKCPYCSKDTILVGGRSIYPHRKDLHHKKFWLCYDCRAYVGCHRDTYFPLGTPANNKLRRLRSKCHDLLDPLWRQGPMTRKQAYLFLQQGLGISRDECHIALFDEPTALRAVELIRRMPKKKKDV